MTFDHHSWQDPGIFYVQGEKHMDEDEPCSGRMFSLLEKKRHIANDNGTTESIVCHISSQGKN